MNAPVNGSTIKGFLVIDSRPIPGMGGHGLLLEHERLGTRMLHIIAPDEEPLAALIIPTPPADDTGLPHIMEHSVLGGSKRFPLKDPFFEMIKCSLATFINAMTYDNFTVYPFSSVVKKDLFNLAQVYFDAVFHPNITENTFRREAYHLTPDGGTLQVNGIVYNEMKAAYSSPDSLLWRETQRLLFPDSSLRFDSGGDPASIPGLTYDAFKRFYDTFYHPSKAYIICYGNIPTEEYCRFFDDGFLPFEKASRDLSLKAQPRWRTPRAAQATYPVGPNEALTGRTYHQMTWIAGDYRDPAEYLSLAVIMQALTGTDASPLKKSVIDSRLGADVNWNMAYAFAPDVVITTGIKGSEAVHTRAYEELVLSTLRKTADDGMPADLISTAIRQLSYRFLERTAHSLIDIVSQLTPFWIYGNDPFAMLDMRTLLAEVQKKLTPDMVSSFIRSRLLENSHR